MKRRPYVPRPYGALAFAHMSNNPRCALWAKPGLGKTVMTLDFLHTLHTVWGEDAPALVLGPKRVAQDVWTDEAAKWQHLAGYEVVSVTGTAEERATALKRDAQVFVMNYENLVWLKDHLQTKRRAWPFRTLVPDEATRLKSFRLKQGGKRAQALAAFAHKDIERVIELTGTPAPNGLIDLWGQLWFLDAGARLGRTFSAFEDRYFAWKRGADVAGDQTKIQRVLAPYAAELIHEKLVDLCLTLDPKDWFDIADPLVTIIDVDLPPSAMAKYREFERELFIQLGGHDIEAFAAEGKTMKCLQLANGFVYVDAEKDIWVHAHDAKLEALESLVEELAGAPLLCAYHFKPDLAKLKAYFPDALDLSKDADLKAAKAGKGRLWLCHPASLGHGVDGLQEHCCDAAFFSHWWDLELHDQVIERVGPMRQLQAGKDRAVNLYYLVARKTIDTVVVARRHSKTGVQRALMDYMKGNR